MKKNYQEIVQFLESLQIMPKTMPGLHKISKALLQTDWFSNIDANKVIVVAGTNGKGSTCAILEALLLKAGQRVGFYSSPHLITTSERIRRNGKQISEADFVEVFEQCESLIQSCELSHFESLTLMAGHFYFSDSWSSDLDYIILEVGLGGSFDATNAFPHQTSVITPIDFDHISILGNTITEIAKNKLGIIQKNNRVVCQTQKPELTNLISDKINEMSAAILFVEPARFQILTPEAQPVYRLETQWGSASLNLSGKRAAENAMTAITVFQSLGFKPEQFLSALNEVHWNGRMQKVLWPNLKASLYLSGDHNPHGIKSLIEILKSYSWKNLHLIVGIGQDKDAKEMLSEMLQLQNINLHLTVTPFKGLKLDQYPPQYLNQAQSKNVSVEVILNQISKTAVQDDLVVVTGSLYLVGEVLKLIQNYD